MRKMDSRIISQQEGCITFEVDPSLPRAKGHLHYARSGKEISKDAVKNNSMTESEPIIRATSLDDKPLFFLGWDVCFRLFVKAYAEHRPVVITPDMIWLLICQGFSHHINLNPEKFRNLLVSHDGKMDIVVKRDNGGNYNNEDIDSLVSEFSKQVAENTKGTIASDLVANFSTTGPVERITSQITLLDAVKPYFEFIHLDCICGIPYIKLKGTPEDWQSMIERIHQFDRFGLKWWTTKLEPILKEFVAAAMGHPEETFWRSIVKKLRPDELIWRSCIPDDLKPTEIDGWILTFFPYCQKGRTPGKVSIEETLLPETVTVPFIHRIVNNIGEVIQDEPLEMTAGFMGVRENPKTYELTPVMGWVISNAEEEKDIRAKWEEKVEKGPLVMRISRVPETLKGFKHIHSLDLEFVGPVDLPTWMDEINIDILTIRGKLSKDEKAAIRGRFDYVRF